ncbi:MAG: hypothetical protein U0359_41310 [Byssovorax sp.]
MHNRSALSLALLGTFALLGACSSSSSSSTSTTSGTTSGTGGSGTTTGATTSTGTAGATGSGGGGGSGECPAGPGYAGGEQKINITSIEATVVDLDGAPMPDTSAQVCGIDICITGVTDKNGHVLLNVNKELLAPAFKFGDALLYAKLAIPVSDPVVTFPKLVTAKLPASGVKLEVGKDLTSGPVTLNVAAGGTIIVDDLTYDTDDKQLFRAAAIPVDQEGPVLDVDPTLKLELLYGVSPIETIICPAAKVTVPNDANWPAGTDVEFVIHGVDVSQEWAAYGKWQKVSDGKVSADGKTVSTVDGGGLPVITAFGIRKKQ